ncbi:MAG: hypothetical protein ACQES9_06590 [Myxococcota bacterium]
MSSNFFTQIALFLILVQFSNCSSSSVSTKSAKNNVIKSEKSIFQAVPAGAVSLFYLDYQAIPQKGKSIIRDSFSQVFSFSKIGKDLKSFLHVQDDSQSNLQIRGFASVNSPQKSKYRNFNIVENKNGLLVLAGQKQIFQGDSNLVKQAVDLYSNKESNNIYADQETAGTLASLAEKGTEPAILFLFKNLKNRYLKFFRLNKQKLLPLRGGIKLSFPENKWFFLKVVFEFGNTISAESYISEFQKYFQKFANKIKAKDENLLVSLRTFSVHPEGNKVFMQWYGRDFGLLAEIIKTTSNYSSGKYDQ